MRSGAILRLYKLQNNNGTSITMNLEKCTSNFYKIVEKLHFVSQQPKKTENFTINVRIRNEVLSAKMNRLTCRYSNFAKHTKTVFYF